MERKYKVTNDILASGGQRFINYIIDIAIIYGVLFILMILLVFITSFFNYPGFYNWTQNIGNLEGYIVFFSIQIPYHTFLESYTSRTIAKYITKTMVVDEYGAKIALGTAFKRTLCRLIPFDALTFLGGSRGWHDSIPDVYVVKKELFLNNKTLFNSFEEIGKSQQ